MNRLSRLRQRGQSDASLGLGCGAVILVFLLVIGLFTFKSIDPGHVGVVISQGQVQSETLKPGWHIVLPFFNNVEVVDTRIHGIAFGTDVAQCRGDQPNPACFGSASKEYQDVWLVGVLNVHLDPDAVIALYQNVGLDYEQKLVVPFFATAIKEVVPTYAIGDVLANRANIRQQTVDKLGEKLAEYGIRVDDVALADVGFSIAYTQAIEAKQVAEQQVQTERQKTQQQIQIAQQKIEEAKGLATAQIERARGEAESNRLVSASLTDEILVNRYIEKLAPGIKTILVPSEGGFILDLGDALATPTPTPAP